MMRNFFMNSSCHSAMTIEEHAVTIRDRTLHRLVLLPRQPARAGLIFFHGQGDYIDRYPEILTPFTNFGIKVILTDLPGHGRSPGPRGSVPSMAFVDELLADSDAQLASSLPAGTPIGIAGHSMGGMLALRALLIQPERFQFSWISSPLLEPAAQIPAFTRIALMALARLAPWITRSTGVSAAHCRPDPPAEESHQSEQAQLYHASISLGWARELLEAARLIEDSFPTLPREKPILFTQGKEDSVCPAFILKERLAKLSQSSRINLHEIPHALHEPFTGNTQAQFQHIIIDWLEHSAFT